MKKLQSPKIIIAIVLFSFAALTLLAITRATTENIVVEAEKQSLSIADSSAAGGSYVRFGSSPQSNEYSFKPSSLEDWEFAPQNAYLATNKTRFVSVDGAATGDGTSKNSPISLNRSIAIAQPGDVIYLAPGTYK